MLLRCAAASVRPFATRPVGRGAGQPCLWTPELTARFSTHGFRRQSPRGLIARQGFSLRVFTRRWSTTVGMVAGSGAPAAELLTWSHLRKRFAASVESHSFVRQGLMAGFFYCVGDITAQSIEYLNKARESGSTTWAYDWRRTARMGTFGLLIAGPMLAGWYRTLHAVTKIYRYSYEPLVGLPAVLHRMRVPGACQQATVYQGKCLVQENGPKQLWYNVAAKVVADNCLFNPFFLTCYFVGMGVLEGRSYDDILAKTKDSFHEVWLVGMGLWVPVQVINFRWVPVSHQTTFVTLVATAWKVFLSIVFHREESRPMIDEDAAAAYDPVNTSGTRSLETTTPVLVLPNDGSIYQLVQKQQAEIERLSHQAEEAVRLRAELEQLRAKTL